MVLTKNEIMKEIRSGKLKIRPFNPKNVDAGSIDLTLSDEFRKFTTKKETIIASEKVDYKRYTKKFKAKEVLLNPGDLVLGITKEKVCLPTHIAGFLQGRTRFARIGLAVHVTASFVQPGSKNNQVLEIFNLGPKPIKLKSGEKIVQLILENTVGKSTFHGKYNNQVL